MIRDVKVVVIDIDGTLCEFKAGDQSYSEVNVCREVKEKIIELKSQGFWIILATSRNMRSFNGNVGQILKFTAPLLFDWLDLHRIPYDEIHFGKPWCGNDGYYVDDRAIRPREFISCTNEEIQGLLRRDRLVP